MYKVSVIMPIYNAGKYLENTLNSVINQTIGFENIELILVDDKSTDNSRIIVEEYSSMYSNIKPIFLEKNSGCPGIPRNVGIKNATSDYIMFIDSDDEYFPDICNKLFDTIILEGADIVVCDYLDTINSEDIVCSCFSDGVIFSSEIIYFSMGLVWNCIFKKSIILDKRICFTKLTACEDLVFILNYFIYSKKLVYLKDFIGYHHYLRDDSLSVMSFDVLRSSINSFYLLVKLLEDGGFDDSNRYFEDKIRWCILNCTFLRNKNDIKGVLSALYDFERYINFNGDLPIIYNFINFFILHGNLNIATYICLFLSKLRKSNLLLKIYRRFFLKN